MQSSVVAAGRRIVAANIRTRAFVTALPAKDAGTAANILAVRNPTMSLRIPGLSTDAAEYIRRPFNLGGEHISVLDCTLLELKGCRLICWKQCCHQVQPKRTVAVDSMQNEVSHDSMRLHTSASAGLHLQLHCALAC